MKTKIFIHPELGVWCEAHAGSDEVQKVNQPETQSKKIPSQHLTELTE